MITVKNFEVDTLGEPCVPSNLNFSKEFREGTAVYQSEHRRLLYKIIVDTSKDALISDIKNDPTNKRNFAFEIAGPREKLFFNPLEVTCAIVTCGGLCPGINNVIRSIYFHLKKGYGVKKIYGIRY
ncbi:MAG: ATP-dependent 6-phosphofructokinase, partial [Oligoflexia bacterium]|nr:ATP-dependent 6-phosphofructokinase [Oligoflexia bacterium]